MAVIPSAAPGDSGTTGNVGAEAAGSAKPRSTPGRRPQSLRSFLKRLGPGLVTGASDGRVPGAPARRNLCLTPFPASCYNRPATNRDTDVAPPQGRGA